MSAIWSEFAPRYRRNQGRADVYMTVSPWDSYETEEVASEGVNLYTNYSHPRGGRNARVLRYSMMLGDNSWRNIGEVVIHPDWPIDSAQLFIQQEIAEMMADINTRRGVGSGSDGDTLGIMTVAMDIAYVPIHAAFPDGGPYQDDPYPGEDYEPFVRPAPDVGDDSDDDDDDDDSDGAAVPVPVPVPIPIAGIMTRSRAAAAAAAGAPPPVPAVVSRLTGLPMRAFQGQSLLTRLSVMSPPAPVAPRVESGLRLNISTSPITSPASSPAGSPRSAGRYGCNSHSKPVMFYHDADPTSSLQISTMSHTSSNNQCGAACVLAQAHIYQMRSHLDENVPMRSALARGLLLSTANQLHSYVGLSKGTGATLTHMQAMCALYGMDLVLLDGTFDDFSRKPRELYRAEVPNPTGMECVVVAHGGHYYRVRTELDKTVVRRKMCSTCGVQLLDNDQIHHCLEVCSNCGHLKEGDHTCVLREPAVFPIAGSQVVVPDTRSAAIAPSRIPYVLPAENWTSQEACLRAIVDAVSCRRHVLLHGAGGTGKSHLTRQTVAILRGRGMRCAVVSSTAVSALGIDGITAHKMFGYGVRSKLGLADVHENLRCCDVIYIDEMSMISPALFNFMDRQAQSARKCREPFGGLIIVCVGDVMQLPPVKSATYWFSSPAWFKLETNLVVIPLSRTYRFPNHPDWAAYLAKIRLGICDDPTINTFLKGRCLSHEAISRQIAQWDDEGVDFIELCGVNKAADVINDAKLETINAPAVVFRPIYPDQMTRDLLDADKMDPLRTTTLKVGARVMLRTNDLFSVGLANGSMGILRHIDELSGIASTYFASIGCVVDVPRSTVIHQHPVAGQLTYTWMPLIVSYALSIHKVQGASIRDPCIIDFKTIFEASQAYVALSRVCDPTLMILRSYDRRKIFTRAIADAFNQWCSDRKSIHFVHENAIAGVSSEFVGSEHQQIVFNPLSNNYEVTSVLMNADDFDRRLAVSIRSKARHMVFRAIFYDFETYPSAAMDGEHRVYGCQARMCRYEMIKGKQVVTNLSLGNSPGDDSKYAFSATLGRDGCGDVATDFFNWVMTHVLRKADMVEVIAASTHRSAGDIEKSPLRLCAFNGNSFDFTWFQRYLLAHESDKYSISLTARGSSSLVNLRIMSTVKPEIELLGTHDICDILHMSLSAAVQNYGGNVHIEKGMYPHLYLTDQTYFHLPTSKKVDLLPKHFVAADRQKAVALSDDPHDPFSMKDYDLYDHYCRYLKNDVDLLEAVYTGFESSCRAISGASVFNFYTMASLTWYCFITRLPAEFLHESKSLNRTVEVRTQLYLISKVDNDFVGRAIYGGCVFPRIRSFVSPDLGKPYDEIKSYLAYVDICSMYVSIMMKEYYPFGPHRYADAPMLAHYAQMVSSGRAADLPFGIYEIEFRFDALELHPSVPHRDVRNALIWANCACDLDLEPNPKGARAPTYDHRDFIRGVYTNIDIMNMTESKAEIRPFVHSAMVWGKAGQVFRSWTEKTFAMKSEGAKMIAAGDAHGGTAMKGLGKLMGNALYGVSAMRDNEGSTHYIRCQADMDDFIADHIWTDSLNLARYANGVDSTLVVTGKAIRTPENMMTGKPRYMGAFTLSYTRQMLNRIINAANPYNRTTDARALISQPYYGDTDSLQFHSDCLPLIAGFCGQNKPGLLSDDLNKGVSTTEKEMMRLSPEFGLPLFMKVVHASFPCPKTYGLKYVRMDNSLGSLVKAKGIPDGNKADVTISYALPTQPEPQHFVGSQLTFDDLKRVEQVIGDPDFKGIEITKHHAMRKHGARLTNAERAEACPMYRIQAHSLTRTIFSTRYEGRKYVDGVLTVPHGYIFPQDE